MRTAPILAGLAAAGLIAVAACSTAAPPTAAPATGPGQPTQTTASATPSVPDTATTAPATATATVAPTRATASTPAATRPAAGRIPAAPATRKIVLAPVTAHGAAVAGYRVVSEDNTVDCPSYASSRVSLSRNVYDCNPSVATADVCWPSATPQHVLCLRNPWVPTLAQLRISAPLRPVRAIAAPLPLGLELGDGDHCRLRDGGAWGSPQAHPNYVGFYTCTKHEAVWGAKTGINTSSAAWTVLVGAQTGPLVTRTVVKAYYVTTAG
jgi:hypothetical protein